MYNFLSSGLISYILSSGFKKGFDQYNLDKMRDNFYNKGKKPKYKSSFLTLLLTGVFGGFGMLYISLRIDVYFFIVVMFSLLFFIIDMFLLPFFIFAIILRPIEIAISLLAVFSHNQMLDELENEFNLYNEHKHNQQPFPIKNRSKSINGKTYIRNPYVS